MSDSAERKTHVSGKQEMLRIFTGNIFRGRIKMQSDLVITAFHNVFHVRSPRAVHIVRIQNARSVNIDVAKRIQTVKNEVHVLFGKHFFIHDKGRSHFTILFGKHGCRFFIQAIVRIRNFFIFQQNGIHGARNLTLQMLVFIM